MSGTTGMQTNLTSAYMTALLHRLYLLPCLFPLETLHCHLAGSPWLSPFILLASCFPLSGNTKGFPTLPHSAYLVEASRDACLFNLFTYIFILHLNRYPPSCCSPNIIPPPYLPISPERLPPPPPPQVSLLSSPSTSSV